MALRIGVVGPGRVGTALATLWSRSGCEVVGFVGRRRAAAERAVAASGAGRAIEDVAELGDAECVLLAVPDGQLVGAVQQMVAGGAVRSGGLWLHASGLHGLEILEPLAALGAQLGSLHPVCPVPDAAAGVRDLPGKPAVLQASEGSARLLETLVQRAGMRPVWMGETDRATYHAACALAANGLTALFDTAERLLRRGCGEREARDLTATLMRAAVDGAAARGPGQALSGPVRRGEADVVGCHLDALGRDAPDALAAYRALMADAARLAARASGLSAAQRDALLDLLG